MTDFIEYVVAELKSKRLSKTDAAALVRQFAVRSSSAAAESVLHPLVHRNTSDLDEQRYSTTWTGEEFFLADHQVAMPGAAREKVLPGVAYLEMARAAIEQAVPARPAGTVLELHHTVWAQPLVVREATTVSVALTAHDEDQIDFEIYSEAAGAEVVHCQGRAGWSREPAPARLDLAQLTGEMGAGAIEPRGVYAACAGMGLHYGPTFQSLTALSRGSGQVLARLQLPSTLEGTAGDYVLHPSLVDGALQAAVGLLAGEAAAPAPRLPFALEVVRLVAPCPREMVAWVRYAPGQPAADPVVKLDLDVCDVHGNVCVQLHGVSSRELSPARRAAAAPGSARGHLLATPVWHASAGEAADGPPIAYRDHQVVLCEFPHVRVEHLAAVLPHSHCVAWDREDAGHDPTGPRANLAERYSAYAVACFDRIHGMLRSKPPGRVLLQIVVADEPEPAVLAGLSGLLKTAALEQPDFSGQLLLVPADTPAEALARWLQTEQIRGRDPLIRYADGARQVVRWHEVPAEADRPPIAWHDPGVYLITGGLGALGLIFARAILAQTRAARVVLTGRGALTEARHALVDGLAAPGRVRYRPVDLLDREDVTHLVAAIRAEWGPLTGIVHCAGMIADRLLLHKDRAQFQAVLAPKVTGTVNLDQASQGEPLEFFVLCSSLAGALGNVGQADYATANGFLDQFAAYRNRQVAAGQRHGRTRAINWPWWQAGGMRIDEASQARWQQTTGMQPMQTATGLAAFARSLAAPADQVLVVEGDLPAIRRTVLGGPARPAAAPPAPAAGAAALDGATLIEQTQAYLRTQLSGLLKLPPHQIDPHAALETYGIDSILAMQLTHQLEETFGSLSKTLFFEYQTIRALTDYFIAHQAPRLTALFAATAPRPHAVTTAGAQALPPAAPSGRRSSRRRRAPLAPPDAEPIAIIGVSGRYPGAVDLDAYWQNLREGKDCITEVPPERWDWRAYFSDDRRQSGHHYSKWGGFIAGVDEFDPLFFNIAPAEAERIDPQERLFLQHAWMAVEDAGYTRASLQVPSAQDLAGQVGVYVGVMYSEYQLFGAEARVRGHHLEIAGSVGSIANRVSYALNLHGPSLTLDTMCSSSLTAIHLACQDLTGGRTSLAIAGGVNVSIHPNKYLVLSAGQFISSAGHCQSFGEGGDGYVPGEGVGVVVLKRLAEATRDGDHIYGLIRGSALTHGGKTNGYTVPNPQAQASAIRRALAAARTDARHVSYIEAHGTGTKLGDPIEIAALSHAFQHDTADTGFCAIGSVKSNIGHCESAAGIAGLTKVLLQLQHQQIVPSLHAAQVNPHIDFPASPFVVNQTLRPWERPVIGGQPRPRVAGVSSFGAGGSNAHLIVEEYAPAGPAPAGGPAGGGPVVIVLSARTAAQLQQQARDLWAVVRARGSGLDLAAVAYTLQVGREAMDDRLGFIVSSVEQLAARLQAYLAGEVAIADTYQGRVTRHDDVVAVFSRDGDLQQTIDHWLATQQLAKLVELWVRGVALGWRKLYGEVPPARISLPTYPFAQERYWIAPAAGGPGAASGATPSGPAIPILHPLLHRNTSDLDEQRYSTTWTGEEFFLADHQVAMPGAAREKVLPGVAYLEMARAAIEQAVPARPAGTVLELHHTVWAQPLVVREATTVSVALTAHDEDQIDFEIYSEAAGAEVVHCQGRAGWSREPAPARLDLAQLTGEMGAGAIEPRGVYAACAGMGLHYGPTFQSLTALSRGSGQVLARLQLPSTLEGTAGDYVLHPSLVDGALQAAVGLLAGEAAAPAPRLPFALEVVRLVAPCPREMVAWVRYAPGQPAADPVVKLDLDVCDVHGNVCVQLHGVSSRELSPARRAAAAPGSARGHLLATPVWHASAGEAADGPPIAYRDHQVVLCEFPHVRVEHLAAVLPHSHCVAWDREDAGHDPTGPRANLAERYSAYAVACFDRIHGMLRSKPPGRVLLQIVVADEPEPAVLAGLSGLLKTAALEQPDFSGQLLLVPADTPAEALARWLQTEQIRGRDPLIRYADGARQVVRWHEVPAEADRPPIAWHDPGVYLITGGLGALGLIFARAILAQTRAARVVLTGRGALTEARHALVDGLAAPGRVRYRPVDLLDREDVTHLVAAIRAEWGPLTGIVHCAGMIADRLLLHKDRAQFQAVLAPKVTGTVNLDQASQGEPLEFFVLCSSLAGALGNVGQADYATANGFLDQFAAYRNRQVAAGQRHGRTRAINWPWWQAGGMRIDEASQARWQQTTGMQPMQTATGLAAFARSLAAPADQVLVVEGDLPAIRRTVLGGPARPAAAPPAPAAGAAALDGATLIEQTQAYLRTQLSGLLKLPPHQIDPHAALETYGIDSILAMQLTHQLEETFGSLSKTLFFEYQTISGLAGYFVKAHPSIVGATIGRLHEKAEATTGVDHKTTARRRSTPVVRSKNRISRPTITHHQDIAIVGLGGRYPQAANLHEFWRNLQSGRDCITEIPPERWDHSRYDDPDPSTLGTSYSKWGGFVPDVDKFDPLFFNISPKEAALIDPQERLFLETAWQTIEDAGYTRASISGSRVGVFVGVMWGQYELYGAEALLHGSTTLPGSSHASIANRVSYFFDFHGPSIALDTMCSSSLTAIHLACEELRKGEIDAAIAGGVNLTIHPYKYLSLSQGKFASSDGKCRSFGAGGDGYVPGEGVGAILLKPLEHARRDGDQVYAVIKSSTVNHGGKTNGYTVPNPNAQAALILDALKKANIDPGSLSYVETHGTGTSLGDPIEMTGLMKAFEGCTAAKQFCPIGSVKSNIGHLEAAAGIAAVTKALLQIRHQQLVPSLHADPPNPHIDFADSPFYVQTELTDWKRTAHPRRVAVSSFGAGGSNAHLILEEYADPRESEGASRTTPLEAFVLSARDPDALGRYAERIALFLEDTSDVSLANISYTSQVGREQMDARLVIITSSVADLRDKLNQWLTLRNTRDLKSVGSTSELADVFYGNIKESQYRAGDLIDGQAGRAFLADLLLNRDLEKIARLWLLGVPVDWSLMHRHARSRRVSLPTYPFAKERCWIEQATPSPRVVHESTQVTSSNAGAGDRNEAKQRTHYHHQWTLKPIAAREAQRPATGPILVLDGSDGLFLTMKDRLENGSGREPIVLVKPGNVFQEITPTIYVIDPEREEHFHELVETLRHKGLLPSVVLHHSLEVCNLEVTDQVAQQLNTGIYTLFHLCKALMKAKHQGPLRIMSVFSSHTDTTAPLGAAIDGFFKTLRLENPRYLAKAVEIQRGPDEQGDLSLPARADLILDELQDDDWKTTAIRYRRCSNGKEQSQERYTSGWAPHQLVEEEFSALPLRHGGVYLVTGGMGDLGFIFGEYLVRKVRANLVLVGRSAINAEQEEKLRRLRDHGAEILFVRADASKLEEMEMVVREAKTRFAEIHGVIHAAGVTRDAFILKKTKRDMEDVLAPKVYGAINIDLATRGENLDWFVLFSSVAGSFGNVGQGDYAYANRFLDWFAESRQNLTRARRRSGRTLSINWPWWQEGGMQISSDAVARLERQTGMSPLRTQDGIRYLEEFLRSDLVQSLALYGIPARIAAYIADGPTNGQTRTSDQLERDDRASLFDKTEAYLKAMIGEEIKLAPDRIGSSDRFESFGVDSVMINRFNAKLERDLGALPKTLLYEHETIRELAAFLLHEAQAALIGLFGSGGSRSLSSMSSTRSGETAAHDETSTAAPRESAEPIAVIGIHGYYPHSADLDEYWDNLAQGKELIELVPPTRWDCEEFYHPDPIAASKGKIYCKFGGFLDDYDKFDPQFFNIASADAKMIDPQERLFLESVWAAIEDAGYTRNSLKKCFPKERSADVGVFVGVTTNSYHLLASDNNVSPSALPWSIANRVSYFFDFNGPSLPVDTACSSSLVAVHLACESLRHRGCQVAIAGGVNLYLHPAKYQSLCQRRMLSRDGKCHSYGAGDDGFVPGEGVGTLVLKRLGQAIHDHDHIYAVIPGSAFEHSGRSNGYSAPNPNAQANLISRTLESAGIHAETIGYVEGHGTGTRLGDSLEVAALTQAFQRQTTRKQFCAIGSVKANIGHAESAAGMAGLAKVILQMKHRQLAPSLHADEANPDIDFEESPFYLQRGLSDWVSSPVHPRRALINSFGAGGVNACVILEEFEQAGFPEHSRAAGPQVFTLSAKNEERLREYVNRLLRRLRSGPGVDLASLCHTFQAGREAMDERLAVVVADVNELIDRLGAWSTQGSSAAVHRGSGGRRVARRVPKPEQTAMEQPDLIDLASRWAAGEEVDWGSVYPRHTPRRLALPTYPFARERCWVSDSLVPATQALDGARLHPLISHNTSTLREISFSSSLSAAAFYAVDHQVNGVGMFPAAGFVEMACIAGNMAGEQRVRKIKDIVWIQPVTFGQGARTVRTVVRQIGESVEYAIVSQGDDGEAIVHSEGGLIFRNGWTEPADAEEPISIQALKARCAKSEAGATYYDEFAKRGFDYGPAFRTIREIYINESFALSRLQLAEHLQGDCGQFILHPSLIDGALQTVAGLVGSLDPGMPYLPFALDEVEVVRPLPQTCYAYAECADSRRQSNAGVRKFNIRLLNDHGDVLIKFKNLYVRALNTQPGGSHSSVGIEMAAT